MMLCSGFRRYRWYNQCTIIQHFASQACIYKNAIRMTMRLQKNCHFKIMPINVIETEVPLDMDPFQDRRS